MKNNKAKLLAVAVAMGISAQASAAIELYNQDGTTFSVDGYLNAFYTYHDGDAGTEQSRVRMGFLPNIIGFNASKQVDDLKIGARSSFWVNINDSQDDAGSAKTATGIDVRQFYATIDGDFGQVKFGKDFGIYGNANIFSDELVMGLGVPAPQGSGTSFGNITSGYPYANPTAQIAYTTPMNNGFQATVGILDPNFDTGTAGASTDSVRFEAEARYNTDFDGGSFKAWLGGAAGESNATSTADAQGIAYGAQIKTGGFAFTASGFDQEGISSTFASQTLTTETDSDGYLIQASYSANGHRAVLSHGETDHTAGNTVETDGVAYFYSVNDNLTLVGEYTQYEDSTAEDFDTIALGVVFAY